MTIEESELFELWENRRIVLNWIIKELKDKFNSDPFTIHEMYKFQIECRIKAKEVWGIRGFDENNNPL